MDNNKKPFSGQIIIVGSFVAGLAGSAALGAGQHSIEFAVLSAAITFTGMAWLLKKGRNAEKSTKIKEG